MTLETAFGCLSLGNIYIIIPNNESSARNTGFNIRQRYYDGIFEMSRKGPIDFRVIFEIKGNIFSIEKYLPPFFA